MTTKRGHGRHAPIGAIVRVTYHTVEPVAADDVLVTATGRVYVVLGSRKVRSKRSDHLYTLRCLISESIPPGARTFTLKWWSRGGRGRERKS